MYPLRGVLAACAAEVAAEAIDRQKSTFEVPVDAEATEMKAGSLRISAAAARVAAASSQEGGDASPDKTDVCACTAESFDAAFTLGEF